MAHTSHKRRLILGGLFFALMFFYLGATLYFHVFEVGSYTGWNGYSKDGRHFYTSRTDPTGPTAALREGDEILAINGVHPAQDFSVLELPDRVPPGTPFTMTVSRNGQVLTLRSHTAPFPPGKYPYDDKDRRWLLLNWLLFLTTGLVVLLLKPDNRQAWLLALMLGTFVGTITNYYPFSAWGRGVETLVALAKIAALWFFPLFPLFFLNFPERSPLLRRFPRLEGAIYWSMCVLLLPYWLGNRLPGYLKAGYANLPGVRAWLDLGSKYNAPVLAIAAYLAAGFLFMAVSYRGASAESRKRMRVAVLGSSAGFFALFLLVLNNFEWVRRWPGWAAVVGWTETLIFFTLPLIPLSFAYAIVRHKIIPISLIIRRGVRYLLVARGSMLVEVAVVALVLWALMDRLFARLGPSSGRTAGAVSAVVAIIAWQSVHWLHRRYLAPVIDRRFFRESYDAQQILTELAESVRSTTNVGQLLGLIAGRIQKALHSESVTIFLRDGDSRTLTSAVSLNGIAAEKQTASANGVHGLPDDSPLVRRLAVSAQALRLDGEGLMPGDGEAAALGELRPELLLPLAVKDKLLGVVALGPRAGDLPYSRDDERMLMNVAAQTALSLENTRLIERAMEQERRRQELEAENEQRAKELEEARQLQLSMLPKQVPELPGLEVAAYMKTASEVGGDYYDFHLADDGTLTIAVGDATGHGLKAGTVVTAMKSLFRTFAGEPDAAQILRLSSRVLKEMNLRAMFMALAVAKIKGRSLVVAGAGMPPLLVYRAATRTVESVPLSGAPLGSLKNYAYRQQELALAPGDVALFLSDGFTELFNEAGEMLGDEAAARTLAAAAHLAPPEIIGRLTRVGDEWAGARPQDDDVTFVAVKMTGAGREG
jgi:phosphoserine phosphatase RsbU/P